MVLGVLLMLIGVAYFPAAEACITDPPPAGEAPGQDLSPEEYNQLSSASTSAPGSIVTAAGARNSFPKGCGHSRYWNAAGGSRIVGGVTALRNEFPWQVRLSIKRSSLCGASILNSRWILTAAHCAVLTTSPSDIIGYFADHDARSSTDPGEFTVKMDRIVVHPHYSSSKMDNDFALLRLSSELSFDEWPIQPVCLPRSCNDECSPGDLAFVSGWGTTAEKGQAAALLQKAKVPIASKSSCVAAYSSLGESINDVKVCAGYAEGGVDSCQGDSGGPMTCPKYGYFMQIGVVSYGIGCGRAGAFGVYARVCKVLDWIGQTVGSARSLYYFSTTDAEESNSNLTVLGNRVYYNHQDNTPRDSDQVPIITGGEPVVVDESGVDPVPGELDESNSTTTTFRRRRRPTRYPPGFSTRRRPSTRYPPGFSTGRRRRTRTATPKVPTTTATIV